MKVEIATRHGHLSADHQAEVRDYAEKLLHYFERLTFIDVTVDLQHPEKTVEIIAKCEHKHDFVGKGHSPDVIAALHQAVAKVKTQIAHHKQKLQDHRHDPAHSGLGQRGVQP